jgi:sugar lactone lactonase YvrE
MASRANAGENIGRGLALIDVDLGKSQCREHDKGHGRNRPNDGRCSAKHVASLKSWWLGDQ